MKIKYITIEAITHLVKEKGKLGLLSIINVKIKTENMLKLKSGIMNIGVRILISLISLISITNNLFSSIKII